MRLSADTEMTAETRQIMMTNKSIEKLRGHRLTVTSVCIDCDDQFAFSGSKDGSIIKWCLETNKIIAKIPGVGKNAIEKDAKLKKKHHIRHINCLSISSDNKYLASGGWDMLIRIWNPLDMCLIHTFSGHRSEVTALIFRKNSHQLYSASADKSIKLWTLEEEDQMAYIESLFGHESTVTSIDVLKKERLLTSGGRDQSLRIWKIVEQAQTVYLSQHESADVAKYIDDKTFISAGEDGSLNLWTTEKRNPVFIIEKAHKLSDGNEDLLKQSIRGINFGSNSNFWISSLATHVRSNSSKDVKRRRLNNEVYDKVGGEDVDSNSDADENDEKGQGEKPHFNAKKSDGIFVASGSCNSVIKIWQVKIAGSSYSMKFIKSILCQGFINDLQFSKAGDKIIAAVGQEYKWGRWWKVQSARNKICTFETGL